MSDIKSILESLGYKLFNDGGRFWRCAAIFRNGDNPTAIRISKKNGRWIDFVAGTSGDWEKLIQISLGLKKPKDAKQWLENKQYFAPSAEKIIPKIIMADTWEPKILDKLVKDYSYWNKRGVNNETVELFKGGMAIEGRMLNRYVFPIFDEREEKIIGFAGRDITNKRKIPWKIIGSKHNFLWPLHLNRQNILEKKEVILVESIGDTLKLWQSGFDNVLCLFGNFVSDKIISALVGLNLEKIYISLNNDVKKNNVGNQKACEAYLKLIKFFDKNKIQVKLPQKAKDFGEQSEEENQEWYKLINLAVVGSREFGSYDLLKRILEPYKSGTGMIVSGGAIGTDRMGKRWADENNIPCIEFFPEWNKFGKAAGFIRNEYIIANADKAVAFWRKGSRGTENDIDLANKMNKPIEIIDYKSLEKERK